jgi:hypothetical protein
MKPMGMKKPMTIECLHSKLRKQVGKKKLLQHALDSRHVLQLVTKEVLIRPRNQIPLPSFAVHNMPEGCHVDPEAFKPRLVSGVSVQGLLETKYVPDNDPVVTPVDISGDYSDEQFRTLL